MKRFQPLQVVVYQDVLCAWCYVADARLEKLRDEFGDALVWKFRPFPLRVADAALTDKARAEALAEIDRARKEPEGKRLSPELWMSPDLPRSSVPALTAVEAARLQSPDAARALVKAMQRTALELGLNVTRPDIVFELAQAAGLHMGRFTAAYQSEQLRRLVLDERRTASARGISAAPTVVLGERWMLCGLKSLSEYRARFAECLQKRSVRRSGADSDSFH